MELSMANNMEQLWFIFATVVFYGSISILHHDTTYRGICLSIKQNNLSFTITTYEEQC